ncbi:FAD-binding oxidoreductase [Candidatus Poribacteria bacterium]|nr:FAD-binding oxidoreductase [Candidatus Poribacteria bacterium]
MTYECDGATLYKATPHVVVLPDTAAQVSEIVKYANRVGAPFVARGAGTGLSGGATALAGGILIGLNRMNRILSVDIENERAVVEPGVVNLWITGRATPDGYHYAPDPASQKACTIGGNVAENSGGPHTLKYGVTTNHICGMEWVMPTGEIVELGGASDDGVGYDIRGLVIGSEGTLGIATKIVVKLTPNPPAYKTMLAVFASLEDASTAVSEIIGAGMIPSSLEVMDRLIIDAVEAAFSFGFPEDAQAVLLIELDGVDAGMEEQAADIVDICNANSAQDVQVAASEEERTLLWKSRKQAFGALGRLAKSYLTQDGVVPRTRLPEVLRTVAEASARHDVRIANVFHAGDGNIHPILLFDESDPAQTERVLQASGEILTKCVELGGTITGEHGVGIEKLAFMDLLFSPADLRIMRDVRSLFDPNGLCNPGKIFPGGGPAAQEAVADG